MLLGESCVELLKFSSVKCPVKLNFYLFSVTNQRKTAEVENAEWEIPDSH